MKPDYHTKAENDIVSIAINIKNGKRDIIEGARNITRMRFKTSSPDDGAFFPFRAIESETDGFLTGEKSAHFPEGASKVQDDKRSDYIESIRSDAYAYCDELIARFS